MFFAIGLKLHGTNTRTGACFASTSRANRQEEEATSTLHLRLSESSSESRRSIRTRLPGHNTNTLLEVKLLSSGDLTRFGCKSFEFSFSAVGRRGNTASVPRGGIESRQALRFAAVLIWLCCARKVRNAYARKITTDTVGRLNCELNKRTTLLRWLRTSRFPARRVLPSRHKSGQVCSRCLHQCRRGAAVTSWNIGHIKAPSRPHRNCSNFWSRCFAALVRRSSRLCPSRSNAGVVVSRMVWQKYRRL